jgi:hypothetical protein
MRVVHANLSSVPRARSLEDTAFTFSALRPIVMMRRGATIAGAWVPWGRQGQMESLP